jgi:NADH:ubiquinone oxidoreductase subunit 5 (subunit L)/multisubunit Na+/H+ antiporter MnhA subunit
MLHSDKPGLSFIFAWESMSLALWALVTFDSRRGEEVRPKSAARVPYRARRAGSLAARRAAVIRVREDRAG